MSGDGKPIPLLDSETIVRRYLKSADSRKYQTDSINDVVNSINQGSDVLIDLPTGTGKTSVFRPIVAEFADLGGRAVVLTANKRAQQSVSKEISRFREGVSPPLVYGMGVYHCPILAANAQTWLCGELKEEYCKPTHQGCGVIAAEKEYQGAASRSPIFITSS